MSDRVGASEGPIPLTRREFTLDAALAILAGCAITISDGCSSSSSPSPAPTPVVTPPSNVNGTVSANHGHTAVITGAAITDGLAISLNIQGTATHPHTLSISQADLAALKNRQTVVSNSSTDNGHSHMVTFTPM